MNEMNELKVLKRKRNIFLAFTAVLVLFFLTWLSIVIKIEHGGIFFGLFIPLLSITIVLWGIIASKLTKYLNAIKRIKELMRIPTDYTEVPLLMPNNKFDKDCREKNQVSKVLIKRGLPEGIIDTIYTLDGEVRYLPVSLKELKKFANLDSIL